MASKRGMFILKTLPFIIFSIYSQAPAEAAVSCSNTGLFGVNGSCTGTDFTSDESKSRLGNITSTVTHTQVNGPFDFTLTAGTGITSTLTNSGTLDLLNFTTGAGLLSSTIYNNGNSASITSITNLNTLGGLTSVIENSGSQSVISSGITLTTGVGALTSTITNSGAASQITGNVNLTTGVGALTSTITNSGAASEITGNVNLTTGAGALSSTITNSGTGSQITGNINLITGAGSLTSTINNGTAQAIGSSINGNINFSGLGVINTTINNFGAINGNIAANAGGVLDFNFVNHGSLTGNINTLGLVNLLGGNSSATFDNQAGATWTVNGTNNILSGDDVLNNHGTIAAAANSSVVLNFGQGVNAVNNAGVIDASNGSISFTHTANTGSLLFRNYILNGNVVSAGTISMLDNTDSNDSVNISGNYDSGWNSGMLSVDANLGLNGVSDKLYITGSATGLTHVTVNDLSPGLASTYNPNGILVVDVDGPLITTDGVNTYLPQQLFTLSSGPVDKGFFDYDLYYTPGDVNNNDHRWYLRNAPNARAYELSKIASATQEAWYESAYAWKDRSVGMRSLLTSTASDQDMPPGPAVWLRAFGTDSKRDTSNDISTASGSVKTDTSYDQRTSGVVAGIDFIAMENEGGGSLLLGVMAGYTHSKVNFDNTGSDASIQGMNVGVYANYANNGFFADGLIKIDRHDIDYKTNYSAADNSQSFDGRSFGALLNTGYRIGAMSGTEGLFFEPTFSFASMRSSFDRFQMLNSDVDINTAGSTRSRIGTRYGRTWMGEGLATEAYVDIGANWEFDANNSAVLSNGVNTVKMVDNRAGNYGDIAVGLNFIDMGSGLSGFAKAQHRFDNEQETSSVQLGIRYKF